jgi:hypothetical protein
MTSSNSQSWWRFTPWTYGNPNLLEMFQMNKDVAHQFFIEPWQQRSPQWHDYAYMLLGPFMLVAMLQGCFVYILYLPFQFIAEILWNVWKRSRRYNGPTIRDPSKARRRRLSIDTQLSLADVLVGRAPGQAKEQNCSSFFTRLPLEIRLQIYELVLGGRALHIHVGTFGPCKLVGTLPFRRHAYLQCTSSDDAPFTHRYPFAAAKRSPYSKDLLSILMVCRQTYAPTVPLLKFT